MKTGETVHCDLLVIGAGLAGMTAGIRAADMGLDTIVAGNTSHLTFASGLMDYLGVYPRGLGLFTSPRQGLDQMISDLPGHAYALTGHGAIVASFDFVRKILARVNMPYVRAQRENQVRNLGVITAMGTLKPSFMVPETMRAGCIDLESGKTDNSMVVAGIKGLSGFSASQVAQGTASYFSQTIPIEVDLPGIPLKAPPQVVAEKMQQERVQKAFVRQILPHARDNRICGMPAVCGIDQSHSVWAGLGQRIQMPLFEIPGSPPSIPGLRLKRGFERILEQAGARLMSNIRIKEPVFDGKGFTLLAGMEPDPIRIRAKGVILATGRFWGKGLHVRRERIVEPLFHLDVAQPTGRHLWHEDVFLSPKGHPINMAGVETDTLFRPLDERGRPVYSRLYAAGSLLAHNDWPRFKSGAGPSIVSACRAVDAFYDSLGAADD
ncbi:MAG: glycerol-3-phosphate dehydrogenase subunit GlpB [Desulfobacter sp.]|nr:MAG: glycerol-3-phosphate dehydrogenase subunit GlpB [Desulfobacter sp.]